MYGTNLPAMAPHSSTFAWKIPWMEEPGGLRSMGSLESDTTEQLHLSLNSICLHLPCGTQGSSWRLGSVPYKQETGGPRKASVFRSSQGLAHFLLQIRVWLKHSDVWIKRVCVCVSVCVYLAVSSTRLYCWNRRDTRMEGLISPQWLGYGILPIWSSFSFNRAG